MGQVWCSSAITSHSDVFAAGRYAELAPEARKDIVQSMHQRWSSMESPFKKYEFLSCLRAQSSDLYDDIAIAFPGLTGSKIPMEDIMALPQLSAWLKEQNEVTFPCWFYAKQDSKVRNVEDVIPVFSNR